MKSLNHVKYSGQVQWMDVDWDDETPVNWLGNGSRLMSDDPSPDIHEVERLLNLCLSGELTNYHGVEAHPMTLPGGTLLIDTAYSNSLDAQWRITVTMGGKKDGKPGPKHAITCDQALILDFLKDPTPTDNSLILQICHTIARITAVVGVVETLFPDDKDAQFVVEMRSSQQWTATIKSKDGVRRRAEGTGSQITHVGEEYVPPEILAKRQREQFRQMMLPEYGNSDFDFEERNWEGEGGSCGIDRQEE